ncbi:nitric oxide dioxygenase [Methylophaga sp. 42_25_T18]|nr:nitric oxide dioxygenase [Methylophaga sp. 42_25_T18]OUR85587.1 nitric oxide dioxygenase [Methylophaga sp. 42_8_T64]
MLSEQTIETVQSTIPLLAEHGLKITEHFYEKLFKAHPELKNVFNENNQKEGNQARALADAVFAYANNLTNIEALIPAVQRIANKHVSLGIKPEQYPIVGQYLLAAIQDVLSLPDDHPALTAWAEAYGLLADVFINTEEGLYKEKESADGGWRGFREFVIADIVTETPEVKSFYLKPKDKGALPAFNGGQYVGIKVSPENSDYEQIRQYSLSGASGKDYLRITTKAELNGLVSTHLHKSTEESTVQLQVPAGVFNLDLNAKKHVFIAGGVGITPLISMLYEAIDNGIKPENILFIQCQRDETSQILKEELASLQREAGFRYKTSFMVSDNGDNKGFLNTSILNKWLTEYELNTDGDTAVYFCGPKPFMSALKQCCLTLGFAEEAIHYESFGPTTAI